MCTAHRHLHPQREGSHPYANRKDDVNREIECKECNDEVDDNVKNAMIVYDNVMIMYDEVMYVIIV